MDRNELTWATLSSLYTAEWFRILADEMQNANATSPARWKGEYWQNAFTRGTNSS